MKVAMVIDHLGSGGAQRQFCYLAKLLRAEKYEVQVITYYPHDFFYDFLNDDGEIPVVTLEWRGQLSRLIAMRKELSSTAPDVVISFLDIPSFLCELISLTNKSYRLIVSERDCECTRPSLKTKLKMLFHQRADVVVPNSYAQGAFINKYFPKLGSKVQVITNMVDLERFSDAHHPIKEVRAISVLARVCPQKDVLTFISAIGILKERGYKLVVNWYGRVDCSSSYNEEIQRLIYSYGLEGALVFNEPSKDVVSIFNSADLICLPSIHEGCPNVVCESMASGVPVVAANAGDGAFLVNDGQAGYAYECGDVDSLVQAIEKTLSMSSHQLNEMQIRSVDRATELCGKENFFNNWKNAITR